MAETTIIAPRPMRMSLATGARGVVAGAATAAGGQQSLTLAVIAGTFVLAAAIAGPLVTEWIRQRLRKPTVDHHSELISEQAEFIEHLRAELVEARADLADKDDELRKVRRRRA